jgi:DNA-binding response OmpR family regulator
VTAKRTNTSPRLLVVDDDPRYGQWLGHHLGVFCPDSTVTVLDHAGFGRWCEMDSGYEWDILLVTASFGSSPEDPKARGLELLRTLRGRAVFPAVIAVAEDGNELTAVRALQLGAVDYLPKRLLTPERLNTSVRLSLRRIEKRVQRKLANLAHVTDVAPPQAEGKEAADGASHAETWGSVTLAPSGGGARVSKAGPERAADLPPSALHSQAEGRDASPAREDSSPGDPVRMGDAREAALRVGPVEAAATQAEAAGEGSRATDATSASSEAASSDDGAGESAQGPTAAEIVAGILAAEPASAALSGAAAQSTGAAADQRPGAAAQPRGASAEPAGVAVRPRGSGADDGAKDHASRARAADGEASKAASLAAEDDAAATQLMAPGQLEAILNAATAANASEEASRAKAAGLALADDSLRGSARSGASGGKSNKASAPGPKRSGTPPPPVTAEFIPGYIIKMKIGESEKAVVYLATSISLGINVALKVSKTLRDDTAGRQFLEREYTAIIAIRDPLVVQIYDYGVHAGFEYLAMEYLLRGDLKARMQAGLKETEALRLVERIAAALRVVHNAGLLHRDLKPPNVMLRDNDEVALIDFGLARALDGSTPSTRTGVLRGSPYYMSPEQAQGDQLDVRSDFYSLGIMFYEMLTGRKPYTGATAMEVLQQHVNSPLPPLPHSLTRYEPFLQQLAAKNRNERFANADQIIAALGELRAAIAADIESAVA